MFDRNSIGDLQAAIAELESLTSKNALNSQEQRRYTYLLSKVSLLKSGVSADELHKYEVEKRGFSMPHRGPLTAEQRATARAWQHFVRTGEARAETVVPGPFVNLDGKLGTLVPLEFFNELTRTLAQHSPLFDSENVRYLETVHGRAVQVPWASDVENVATPISESSEDSDTDIFAVGGAGVTMTTYRTPRIILSYETFEDLEGAWDTVGFLENFMADRLARGAGADLLTGNGSGEPLGLIPSLLAVNATQVDAAGSAANTGGSETAADSIGSKDLSALLFSLPAPYRASDKCAYLMNSNTAKYISGLLDKNGKPLIDLNSKELKVYGKPVLIDEGMDDIGPSAIPVIAGDFNYWLTRFSKNTTYIKLYKESVGLVEKGLFGLRLFARVGGQLLYSDQGAPSPFALLRNAS